MCMASAFGMSSNDLFILYVPDGHKKLWYITYLQENLTSAVQTNPIFPATANHLLMSQDTYLP
jgi:hypothetical protein